MGPMGNAIRAVPSHPMGHFPWDSHGNPIPMDKPVGLLNTWAMFKIAKRAIFHFYNLDGRVDKASASAESGFIPSRVKPITLKLVCRTSLIDAQH